MKKIINDCLIKALIESKSFLISIPPDLLDEEFILVGDNSSLESIEIVNILILLEDELNSNFEKKIDCFDLIFSQRSASLSSVDVARVIQNFLEEC